MTTVAVLGTGLLGGGFARTLLRRGESVSVWNRTEEKARVLEAHGARAASDPASAVRGAERIHLSLSDDAAVDEVLERARPSMSSDVVIVDHTTTTASGTTERVKRWDDRGIRFVHAPVFMGPQNALDATGLMLVSGERTRVAAVMHVLERMTGKVLDLGVRAERAAAFKLLGNLFLMFLTSGLAEVFTLASALGVDPKDAATLFEHFNPGATIGARAERMLANDDRPASWQLSMARKDARLMLDEADRAGIALAVLPAIAARMDAVIGEGHGGDDWTILGKDAVRRSADPLS